MIAGNAELGGHMSAADAIVKSFKELIVNMGVPYEKVAVYQICDRAGVSRKTFYVHFKSKADIVDRIVRDEVIAPLMQMSEVSMSLVQNKDMLATLPEVSNEMVYKAIAADKEFYSRLCCRPGSIDSPLVEALIKNIQELNSVSLSHIDFDGPDWKREYISYYFAAGNAVLIQRWIRGGMKESTSELAKLYDSMTTPYWMEIAKLAPKR